ncbi:MAG: rhomboid family intramembrane serine protease [Bacteroidia bacterium]|nr:rhomboid family intramembrane serine protease [Bacteroidia bacterium]MBP9689024.1 rhomboid family intramembrane serine protease [Bacteroidia bacterium]
MTIYLIIITVIVSLVCFNNAKLNSDLIFNPYKVKHLNQWYRMVTSGFQHADYIHLFINMFVLFSFGQAVEQYYSFVFGAYSKWVFLLLYLSSIFAANVSTQYKYQNSSGYNALGASGAVSAVLFTSILFDPFNKIYLYGIIGLPGILLGVAYLVYSFYMGKKQNDNVNHEAHLYGAIYGILFTIALKPSVINIFIHQVMLQF